MEKVFTAATRAGSHWELGFFACIGAALGAVCPAVSAQDVGLLPAQVAQAQTEPPLRVQVQTSTLPRMDAQDNGFQAPRIDVSLFPSAARTLGLGAVVGMSGFTTRQAAQPLGLQPQRPSVDLGVRWTQRLQSQQIDITAWRRMSNDDDAYSLVQLRQPVYGARVEMDLAAGRKSGFAADISGFVGLQLESGARISVKRKDGRPMVYYRTTF
jgi:hypothetical protein